MTDEIEAYLKMTGQTRQYLFGGMHDLGFDAIIRLVNICLKEKKMITWHNPPGVDDGTFAKLVMIREIDYPAALKPDATETVQVYSNPLQVPVCRLTFDTWTGEPVKHNLRKPLVSVDGKPMFAELAILHYFERNGWQARWVCTYARSKKAPLFLKEWKDDSITAQVNAPVKDRKIQKLLDQLVEFNNYSYSGCWDILAWKGEQVVFAESKHRKKDKLRQTQLNWLDAGLTAHLTARNFLLVEWDF